MPVESDFSFVWVLRFPQANSTKVQERHLKPQ